MPLKYAEKFKADVREMEEELTWYTQGTPPPSRYPCPGVLTHADRVFDPQWFVDRGYEEVTMFIQQPGDYILTHPCCAHFVWNWGPCVKEAVAVPSPGWVSFGVLMQDCNAKYASFCFYLMPSSPYILLRHKLGLT
jgi:hypothetical protein